MIKFFRKNRQNSLIEGKVANYFKYAIGEIFLVVMGILIALCINNCNSKRIEKSAAISSYKNIKRQINDDKNAINSSNKQNEKLYKKYITAINIIEQNNRKKIDILGKIATDLTDYSDIDRSSTIYQNLINSGESKLLKNREILGHIQRLEEAYIFVNRIEQIHFEIINNIGQDLYKTIKFYDQSVREPEKIYGIDFQNYFSAAYGICKKKEYAYGIALKEIEIITKLIDEEVK
jgi:tetratricopeptide (TPR) repeat protein